MSKKCTFCGQLATRTVFVSSHILTIDGTGQFERVPCCDAPECLALAHSCYEREEQISCKECKKQHASLLKQFTGKAPCPKTRFHF